MNEQKHLWTLSTLAAHLLITNYLIFRLFTQSPLSVLAYLSFVLKV